MRHKEITIEPGQAFINCKLGREKYAKVLTSIVSSYSDGFVLALNNKWGAGKTTFTKMWKQQLGDDGYETIYFNAWENDFEDNALTALMGELQLKVGNQEKAQFKNIVQKAALISKNILPHLAKSMAAKYTGIEDIQVLIENSTKGFTELFVKEVQDYSVKKDTVKEFKESLREYIKDVSPDKPLIFIVDELDRCRPNYSVSVLEQIKHFFSVEGIVFVLSIDKDQLGHAVRGVYGSDNIDADEYLRRFIDIEFSLPDPNYEEYILYLYKYFSLDDFFGAAYRSGDDSYHFKLTMFILFSNSKVSLRQQEKIFAHSKLVLSSFYNARKIHPIVIVLLVFLRALHYDKYVMIIKKKYTLEDFHKMLFEIIDINLIDEENTSFVTQFEAYSLYFYLKLQNSDYDIHKYLDFGDDFLPFKSSPSKVRAIMINIYQKFNYSFNSNEIIERIELLSNLPK